MSDSARVPRSTARGPRHLRAVRRGRPHLRDRLVPPARPRLRQHDAGRLRDPDRLLRGAWRSAPRSGAGSRIGSAHRCGCTASSSSSSSSVVLVTPDHVPPHPRGVSGHLPVPRVDAAAPRDRPARPRGARPRAGHGPHGCHVPEPDRYLARSSELSRAFGRLYAANTLGAIVGTLAAGLVLIELLGLSGALRSGPAARPSPG